METARSYQGLNEEIKYDKKLYRERKRALTSDDDVDEPPIKKAKEHTERSPTAENIEISSDSDPEPSGKKSVNLGLQFLVEEMEEDGDSSTSSTSDEEFVPEAEQHPSQKDLSQEDQFIIPPSPVPAYTAKSVLRIDRSLARHGRPSTHHIPSRGPSAHGYLCGVRSSPVDRFKGRGAVRDIRRHAIYERHHLQPPSRNLEEVWGSPRPEGDRYEHS